MSTEITKTEKQEIAPITKIRNLLESKRADLMMALPKHLTADRLLRVALTACNKTPKLLECTRESLLACVMDCASLGLEPDAALGRAYLIPYGNTCTLIIGYKGLVDLAYRSGMVDSLDAFIRHENDHFTLSYGLNPNIEHSPILQGNPGPMVGVYAVARLKGVSTPKFIYMTKEEVDSIRNRSKASQNGPWKTDYEEMAKKTAVRRIAKLLPLSVEFSDALSKDGEFDFESARNVTPKVERPLFMSPAPDVTAPSEPQSEPHKVSPPTEDMGDNKVIKDYLDASKKTVQSQTDRMEQLCKDNNIDFQQALKWLGESGVSSFDEYPEDAFNLLLSQPRQFKKTVDSL